MLGDQVPAQTTGPGMLVHRVVIVAAILLMINHVAAHETVTAAVLYPNSDVNCLTMHAQIQMITYINSSRVTEFAPVTAEVRGNCTSEPMILHLSWAQDQNSVTIFGRMQRKEPFRFKVSEVQASLQGYEFYALEPGLLSLAGSPVNCNKVDLTMKPKEPRPGQPTDMLVIARSLTILPEREDLAAVARGSEFHCRGHTEYLITAGVAGGVGVAVMAAATAMALRVCD